MLNYNLYTPEYEYKEEILYNLNDLLEFYINNHSKTMVVRFDLHFPRDYPITASNKPISETIAYVVKKYKRQGLDPMYFWVMEQNRSEHQHYHVVLFLDGQKVRSYSHVFHNVEEAWGRALNADTRGCVHHCNSYQGQIDMNRNGLQVRRCDGVERMHEQIQAVYNQISYLAKKATKIDEKDGLRNFGMSRLH